jgi:hypothetical protein
MHLYPSTIGKYSICQNKHEKCQSLSRKETVRAICFYNFVFYVKSTKPILSNVKVKTYQKDEKLQIKARKSNQYVQWWFGKFITT